MRLLIGIVVAVAVAFAVGARGAEFSDPAPPQVNAVTGAGPAEAVAQKELTFHAAPKALAAGAVVTDWVGFGGPALGPTSPERPLRGDVKDLPIVWEVVKGTGYAHPTVLGERLMLFHRVGDEEVVECLNAQTGRRYWRFAYPCEYQDRYGYT